mmetsp:Transcript_29545/g.71369  ORF Transcript_29545/g.71369 Transcript_29545/m.71369 type:complete len:501 (-) Transcript_29545:1417-2919(-)
MTTIAWRDAPTVAGRTTIAWRPTIVPLPEPMEQDANVAGLAPDQENKIFCIRRNDPNMNHLYIGSGLEPRAWKQLGRCLHNNTNVRYLCLLSCHLRGKSMDDLCTGLQHNQSITEFEIGDNLLRNAEMQSLSPFIRNNPNLHTLNIEGSLGACGVDLLSSALMCRTQSIENISLDGNCMGIRDRRASFDTFMTALSKNKNLRRLSLIGNCIGVNECDSLAMLLKNPDTKLTSLILRHNYIDNNCAAILAESLSNNNQLSNIDLDRNERVSSKGLMKFLELICKTSSRVSICIIVQWRCQYTNDEMSTELQTKINEPLHNLAAKLCANKKFSWASDMKNAKLKFESEMLDWNESPFFYGMKDGNLIDVVVEDWGGDDCWIIPDRKHNNGIHGTLNANHTLSSLGYETARCRNFIHGSLLREFLEANKAEHKVYAQRIKIFRCHVQHYFSLEEFLELDTVVQPHILAWIGRGLGKIIDPPPPVVRLEATYHIIRGMPMLCGF